MCVYMCVRACACVRVRHCAYRDKHVALYVVALGPHVHACLTPLLLGKQATMFASRRTNLGP